MVRCACDRQFRTQNALDQHMRDAPIHKPKKQGSVQKDKIVCNCGKPFASEEALKEHKRVTHPPHSSSAAPKQKTAPVLAATSKAKTLQPTSTPSKLILSPQSPVFLPSKPANRPVEPTAMPPEPIIRQRARRVLANGHSVSAGRDDEPFDMQKSLPVQIHLLGQGVVQSLETQGLEELRTCPVFTQKVYAATKKYPGLFPAFGFLAGELDTMDAKSTAQSDTDKLLYLNVNTPWSAFICGSQGSGKSHSLSCILESFLVGNKHLGPLPQPLTGVVFHYDFANSATGGRPSELAYLASCKIPVRVLVAASNERNLRQVYAGINPDIEVQPLFIDQDDLDKSSLLTLMAADEFSGSRPLYMDIVGQILREMPLVREGQGGLDYAMFQRELQRQNLTTQQRQPLEQRLKILESFIHYKPNTSGVDWSPIPGELTIIDLSCPFVGQETACSLFDICLRIFLSQKREVGRFVALDEAHKFMNKSAAASKLTDQLMTTVREQRHLGCRVIIATQEPTISPKLLDLCSITLIHRFTSPQWYREIEAHVAPIAASSKFREPISRWDSSNVEFGYEGEHRTDPLFFRILNLNVGEAVFCAPTAILDIKDEVENENRMHIHKLGKRYLEVKVRARVSEDGGRSVLISREHE